MQFQRKPFARVTREGRIEGLPSGDAALDLVQGKAGGLREVVGTAAVRAVVIYAALSMAGLKGKKLERATLYVSLAIEAGVIAWAVEEAEGNAFWNAL